jgi:hypothetical protein
MNIIRYDEFYKVDYNGLWEFILKISSFLGHSQQFLGSQGYSAATGWYIYSLFSLKITKKNLENIKLDEKFSIFV